MLDGTCTSQGSDVSNFLGSDQKVAPYQLVVFWVMTPKIDYLLIETATITPKGSMNTANFGKLHCSLSKIMSNKQVLVNWFLESTNDLRSVFVGHIHFKKLMKFRKFIEIFHCCMTRIKNTNLGVFIQCQYTRTILRNKNMGQSLLTKHSQFILLLHDCWGAWQPYWQPFWL